MRCFLSIFFTALWIFTSLELHCQHDRCASQLYLDQQKLNGSYFYPNFSETSGRPTNVLRTIPVVVHVVYRTAAENISDRQIYSQLEVINQDFNLKNTDTLLVPSVFKTLMADIEIKFALARTDPQGQPCTGINRVPTTQTVFGFNDGVKYNSSGGINGWPSDRYLNIWVCNLQSPFLGYSSFPGENPQNDGIVIDYEVFGKVGNLNESFNQGRTLSHELGHYFNLFHIWADENNCFASDSVEDTPVQRAATFGCPNHPRPSCLSEGDMFMNFMDYSNDECLNMFTEGQRQRMRQTLFGFRTSLGTLDLHKPPLVQGPAVRWVFPIEYSPYACDFTYLDAWLESFGEDTVRSLTLKWSNGFGAVDTLIQLPQPLYPGEQQALQLIPPVGLSLGPQLSLTITEANAQTIVSDVVQVLWRNWKDTTLLSASLAWDVESLANTWLIVNPDSLDPLEFTVANTSAFGRGLKCLVLNMVKAPLSALGQKDFVYSPIIKVNEGSQNYRISWEGACLVQNDRFFGAEESLSIQISRDCGVNFTELASFRTADLQTGTRNAGTINSPPASSQWKRYSIDIPMETPSSVQVRFSVENGGRSVLYLDNFSLNPVTESLPSVNFQIFPNPVSKVVNVLADRIPGFPITILLYSTTGQLLGSYPMAASQFSDSFSFNLPPDLASQLLIVSIRSSQGTQRLKLMVE